MKIDMILSVLSEKFPRELVTLSSWSTYHVNYEDEYIFITTRQRQYSIHLNEFLEFVSVVLARRSFVVKDYQYEHKHVPYLLPIVEVILVTLGKDISNYYSPKRMHDTARKHQQSQCKESIDKIQFLSFLELDSIPKEISRTASSSPMHKLHDEEQNVLVEVHYATNRKSCGGEEIFSGERQNDLNYGITNVSIPTNVHKSGNVERPKVFLKFVFKENKNKHFVIDFGKSLTESEFKNSLIEKSQKKSMMIFVHGYNVNFKDAVFKSAQIKYDLTYEWPVLLFSWPSNDSIRSYPSDRENALYSSKCLANLLDLVENLGVEEVIVVAHSMGTFCLAEALSRVSDHTSFQRLALAAADIEKDAFATHYADDINRIFEHTTLYMSSTDTALLASDLVNEAIRVGDTRDDILVVQDMDSIDMSNLDKGVFSLGHSYVSEDNRALDDLYYYLVQGAKADARRLKSLVNKVNKNYWSLHT
ncbi:alpha/beta hydrolase [Vibrio lentus]|uniref:Alpha/beta fold hydrolase n=1 Tax=Vibrio lentus TaxID=136468 RepID=A0A4U2ELB2_9VIBR|nr:alpha/beta hydrolase [Vibrio lentus]TKG02850.1 alpha/beta fold hydrolase [Vibrio lentus]